jgi:C_GCAxxG_C_C family probable redox protein
MELNPAQELMARGYHCSEAVLLAVCQEMGIESELVPRIATAFAGGMARSGEVCGAVSGALMAIGIKHGRSDLGQPGDQAIRLSGEVMHAFRDEMGTLLCRELTGYDLATAEGLAAFRKSDVRVNVCLRAVGFAYDKTLELLRA